MTPEEISSRQDEISGRLKELDTEFAGKSMSDDAREEFKGLVEERKQLDELSEELEVRRQILESAQDNPQTREAGFQIRKERVRGDDIYDLSTIRAAVNSPEQATKEMRERALYSIEQSDFPSSSIDPDEARTQAEKLLRTKDTKDGRLARRMLETGSPTYQRAFGKVVTGERLSDAETRALSTTDANGGAALPYVLDPTVIHTSNYSVNPWRAVARVETTVADNWQGLTSAGVSAGYTTEAAEAGDDAPSDFANPSIHPERADVFIPYSIEIGQDWSGLQAEFTSMIQEAKDDLEATKFAFGTGTNEPKGVLIGGTVAYTTAGTAALAVGDIYGAEEALPPRHRPRASWVANRAIYNRVRQFDTSGGASLWVDNLQLGLNNQVPTPGNIGSRLIGYPAYECSTMGTTVATGGTVAVIGDFNKFVIVDRVGMSIELIPHLFSNTTTRPSGQRGLFAFWRNSSGVLDPNAFRKVVTL